MILTAYLLPASLHLASPNTTWSAQDTGSWGSTDVGLIDEAVGATDDADAIAAGLGPSGGYASRYYFAAYALTAPTPGVTINKVKVWLRIGAPCNNTSPVDISVDGFVIVGSSRYLKGAPATVIGTTGAQGFRPEWLSWEWTTNPATAVAWTVADLASLKIGARFVDLNDPAPSSGPTCKWPHLYLEYEAVSTAGNVEQIRRVGSWRLRMRRRQLRTVQADAPIEFGDRALLEPVWLSHRSLPMPGGSGAGVEAGDRAPLIIVGRRAKIAQRRYELTLLDPTGFACTSWETGVTTLGADVSDTGIARWDRGGGFTVDRAETGYVRRPDGLWTDRAEATPRYHADYGLLITGGGAKAGKHSTFAGYSGSFSNWTHQLVGSGASIVQETADVLFDVTGLRSAAKLTMGSPHVSNHAYLYQERGGIGSSGLWRMAVGVKAKSSGAATVRWLLRFFAPSALSPTTTYDWDEEAGAWTTTLGVWNLVPGSAGAVGETWSSVMAPPGAGTGDARLHVGYVPENSAVALVYAATILHNDGTGYPLAPREWPVTTGSEAASLAEDYSLANDAASYRVWDFARGECNVHVTPLWAHADLHDSSKKILLTSYGQAGHYDQVAYVRDSSTAGRWIFTRVVGGSTLATATLSVAGSSLPARLTTRKIAARWTSSLAELGLPARTLSIWVDGVRGTDAAASGEPTPVSGTARVYVGSAPSCGWYEYADAYFKHREMRDWSPRDEQVIRFAT